MDCRLVHPFSAAVVGPSQVGKSTLVRNLLEHRKDLFSTEIDDIIWCYDQAQSTYEGCTGRFVRGVIDPDDLDPTVPHIVIFDDMMGCKDLGRIVDFFTKFGHHKNCTVFYLCQNMYDQSRGHRAIMLNSHYTFLFRNCRDVQQIARLGRQVFPQYKNFLVDSYTDAVSRPYGYLLLDLKPNTPDYLRVRGRLLESDGQDVYLPKGYKLPIDRRDASFTTPSSGSKDMSLSESEWCHNA